MARALAMLQAWRVELGMVLPAAVPLQHASLRMLRPESTSHSALLTRAICAQRKFELQVVERQPAPRL